MPGADARSDAAVIVRPPDELACAVGAQANLVARSLAAGTYYVAVSASAPTDVQLEATSRAPSDVPRDETCVGAPALPINRTIDVALGDHGDDIDLPCAPRGAVDAAYALDLAAPSDVLLVERIANDDKGGLALFGATCDLVTDAKVCGSSATSPVRVSLRGVPAGSYRAVVESSHRNDVQLTALVRPSIAPSLVPFADTCSSALLIDESGGFFQGNTDNAQGDYSAGCDAAGVGGGGAPDQLLKLVLSSKKRVIFNMQGSGYATLLDVRKGETCPGTEVPQGCSVGYDVNRSFLNLTLDAGTYWVQVDGFAGSSGTWFLDVRTVEP